MARLRATVSNQPEGLSGTQSGPQSQIAVTNDSCMTFWPSSRLAGPGTGVSTEMSRPDSRLKRVSMSTGTWSGMGTRRMKELWRERPPFHHISTIGRRLQVVELGVLTSASHQFVVRADLRHSGTVQNDNEI